MFTYGDAFFFEMLCGCKKDVMTLPKTLKQEGERVLELMHQKVQEGILFSLYVSCMLFISAMRLSLWYGT